jgi:hypothetical protein
MEKLTGISEITGLPMPIKLAESCGEDSCGDICGDYCDKECVGCPIQECITELHKYQESDLSPEEVAELKKSEDFWHREAIRWAAQLGEIRMTVTQITHDLKNTESYLIEEVSH